MQSSRYVLNPLLLRRDSSLRSPKKSDVKSTHGNWRVLDRCIYTPTRLSAVCEEIQEVWDPKAKTQKDEDYLCLVTHLGSFAFETREEQVYYCRRYHELPEFYRQQVHELYFKRSLQERIKLAMAAVQEAKTVAGKQWDQQIKRAATLKHHAEMRKAGRQWLVTLCSELDEIANHASSAVVSKRLAKIIDILKNPETPAVTRVELRYEAKLYADERARRYVFDMESIMKKALRARGSKEEIEKIMNPYVAWKKFQTAKLMSIKVAAMPQMIEINKRDTLLETERNIYKRPVGESTENRVSSAYF